MSFPVWNKHRLTLARRMETSGWFSTALAIRDAQRAALLGQQEPRPLTDAETHQLRSAGEELEEALGRIAPLAHGTPELSRSAAGKRHDNSALRALTEYADGSAAKLQPKH